MDTTDRGRLLTGDLRWTLLGLALPVLLEQFLNFLVGFYDTWLAGHLRGGVSEAAVGAVGVAAYVGWLATMLFALVGAGTTALVSRARGAGDDAEANRVANRSLALAFVAGLAFLLMIYPLAPWVADVLHMSGAARAITIRYLRIDAIGLVFSAVSLVAAAALRGCGNMHTPMWVLGAVSVLNAIASTWFVFGGGPLPALGADGIVAGTVVARFSGGVLMTAALARGVSGLRLVPRELRLRGRTVERILDIGLPAAADGALTWTGHFLFLRIISSLGQTAFAAHVVGVRVEAITYLPAVAWGAAAATMIGQSLGAGDTNRARQAGHEAVRQCSLLGVVITLAFFCGAQPIYALMHNSAAVAEVGVPAFRLLALFQWPLVVGIIYSYALRGAGDTRFPMWVSLVTTFGLRLPLAYVCGVTLDGGLIGAWIGMCADMLARGVAAAVRFRRGKWLAVRV
jgi:putative MATE family efflux protein